MGGDRKITDGVRTRADVHVIFLGAEIKPGSLHCARFGRDDTGFRFAIQRIDGAGAAQEDGST